ncbi:ribulokinase [Photobacterium rosenbergii]|uniref:Ribulokinase n=1 Tax=Photobacterium rosenbergii TaxID=294936 RepID=A0A2T3N9T4_9GAMM|nr:ribulokinase [Photobacterium rosenbergii]PSW10301.1 ribulokinase [Photobacterium rosenbergii]
MKPADKKYLIGLDFGSDSVRAVIVSAQNGKEKGSGVAFYKQWMNGAFSDPSKSMFRQHPSDYINAMTKAIQDAIADSEEGIAKKIVGIGVDTTGSTPAPVDANGEVLALKPEFWENPNAMFILWKDHTSVEMADRINKLAASDEFEDYTKYVGGIYSSEWYWSKAAYIAEQDNEIHKHTHSWVELCDWIPALLTDTTHPNKIKRGICGAGHKALWHESWGGLPSQEFLTAISPTLEGMRSKYSKTVHTSDEKAGTLTEEWATKLGLNQGIAVAVGEFDCHMGAVGAGAGENDLVKVVGTSTCDILMVDAEELGKQTINGICGQVNGSSLPGLVALEAGQSAFGDIYAWYKRLLSWPLQQWRDQNPEDKQVCKDIEESIFPMLTTAVGYNDNSEGAIALDWHNGRRTPNANQRLTGAIANLNLGSDAPELYHALVESTAFGAKSITECFQAQGVDIKRVIAIGGISKKSPLVMQTMSDCLNLRISVVESDQCCAIGAAIFGAVAAGLFTNAQEAQKVMSSPVCQVYSPRPQESEIYQKRFEAYQTLGQSIENLIMSGVKGEM